ncbi:Extracellular matrix-binding ebh, putative [Babesia ovata]|uniref:Extracellular matrix-binding ebh, putative n=1 Tax=Babesia ovata TaxID=189622 RepID=A0A2H6KIZ5_9APIC|nr:Extracellular matrix-binding ebh, putative [Babesia ovata]GBE62965.1 Extracellular matrix-binding ebh, putative [Babesia ovata]
MTSPSRCFVISFFHYSPCPQSLNALLHPSFQWIQDADAAVNAAKEKAEQINGRLDHNKKDQHDGTVIGQNIEKIKQAKDKVSQVDDQLKSIHTDLGNWKDAAHSVLGTAVEKAEEVRDKLDPDGKATIGQNISDISDAKNEIETANKTFEKQVNNLNTWITSAENIRAAAEDKAKEAYDKLKVNKTLDENVKKIVKAKGEIEKVHKNLNSVHGNLGTWKGQASTVLAGAIGKATDVHKALDIDAKGKGMPLGKNIEGISSANDLIKKANNDLKTEIDNLGKWQTAAKEVISKADGKCEEILKKVDQKGKIYVQAQELQKKGKELLEAARTAKKAVESKVTAALKAVVAMDTSLKRDLKQVKEKITNAIKLYVEKQINELPAKVQEDLQQLRGNIEGLASNVLGDRSADDLVKDAFTQLDAAKNALASVTHVGAGSVATLTSELEGKFTEYIQDPLTKAVTAVDSAIQKLGGKFSLSVDKQNVQGIFGHIKERVGEIKGTPGRKGKGLEKIVEEVKGLARAFVNPGGKGFNLRVGGWLEGIIGNGKGRPGTRDHKPGLQAVTSWLEPYQKAANGGGPGEQALRDQVINNIKSALGGQIREAQRMIMSVQNGPKFINNNLTAIVKACETFVEKLDEKIKKDAIDSLVRQIVPNIQRWASGQSLQIFNEDADLKCAVRYTLLALCASVRQVGIELKSLGIDKFGEILDQIKPTVDDLDKQLKEATSPPGIPPTGKNESPAQAVDKRLEAVREKVKGLENKFRENVTKDLKAEVDKLPTAVGAFNSTAEQQIRAAAQTAIKKAAGQISESDVPSEIDVESNMPSFHTVYNNIKTQLPKDLHALLDTHIGKYHLSGYPPFTVVQELKLSPLFSLYKGHVTQPISAILTGITSEGSLPQAIGEIKTVGLAELEEAIGDNVIGDKKIEEKTFNGPFTQIKTQLEAIKKLVDEDDKMILDYGVIDKKGVKTLLTELNHMITLHNANNLYGLTAGLNSIYNKIDTLHLTTFTNQPEAIEKAVGLIRQELGVLRGKLKNSQNGGTKDGVIHELEDLKRNGLGAEWAFGDAQWKHMDNLRAIQNKLKYQNGMLPEQTKNIEETIKAIKQDIQDALRNVGMKLNNTLIDDDVVDKLGAFKLMIGQGGHGGLQGIYEAIQKLQQNQFTKQPQAIGEANEAIKDALKEQINTLGSDVIKELSDLMTNGMSKDKNWKYNGSDVNGLLKIISDLQHQQGILTSQPTAIGGGVDQITRELDELRSELQGKDDTEPKERGVIKNMEFMIKKIGTNDDDPNSLRKIKKEIEELNRDTVPDINKFLGELCAKIASEAGSVDWKLGLFKENNIDKDLAKIKTQIDTLRIDDLQAAIAMCDKFLTNADYIKWEKVENIERFVDSEIEKAIAELSKQARQDYVESAKDALKHFAAKVAEELGELPEEINRDLYTGYKGLMKYAHGHFDSLESVTEEREIAVISSAFHAFYAPVNEYLGSEIRREHREREGEKSPLLPKSQDHYADRLSAVHTALSALLTHITGAQRYGHEVRGLLDALDKALAGLRPECFARPSTAVIDGVTDGLSAFAAELRNAYISAYSGAALTGDLVSSEAVSERSVTVLTPYGEKLSKVLLSMVPILYSSLTVLRTECKSLAGQQLNKCTDLGSLLTGMGYNVPDDGKQDGELNRNVTGRGITMLLVGDFERVFNSDKDTKNALGILLDHLNDYYKACHFNLPRSLRTPCNVYEMLVWLTGLPHNCVYDKLCKFTKLCYSEQTENSLYAATFPADALVAAVGRLTADCPAILTRVLGYGSALTTYACDFHSNSMRLYYPQDGEECLHMMLHCVPVKSVLTPRSPRWLGGVPCNPLAFNSSLPHPECTDKSPLQSYLNDCLPGHLPHQVSNVGCEPLCNTCPSAPSGMPCLTPLGFRGFSGSIKTGKQLCKVLTKWFGNKHLPSLLSLEPRPPATLAEHIGFALSLVNDWHDGKIVPKNFFQTALEASATDLSLRLYNQPGDLTAALTAAYGSDSAKHGGCKHPHLTHLAGTDVCTRHQASPFLQALCRDSYDSLAYRHSDLYLSWAVYLPWTLYDLLLCLYTAFKEISCRDWSCDACLHEGPCDPDSHGVLNPKAPVHGCRCPSIVQCTGVMPTLYQYGLTFKDAPALISQNTTCFSFSTQLSQVLHSEYFRDLFHKCDEFLWHIRMPFLFTIVTLWLTATLYIAHSLLYRMDVLHIRSHLLTTSASHQLDVKALLSRTRRMLSLYTDVDYFDDDFHS